MTLVLKYVARSDRGLVRSNNQDAVYAGPRLLAVADGMGGHAAGEIASKIVIAALAPLDDDEPSDDLLGQLREAVEAGNGAISELVAGDPELDGMGTTLTAILFAGSRLGLVNIGDSRTYLMRGGSVTQITHDDSFVQSLIDEGRITAEEANTHPQRSLLLRALTGHDAIEPTLNLREVRPGDRYLLCSDGLSGVISHETLAEAMHIPDPQTCADRMIELALRGGGPDNVTVIIADVVDVDFGDDAPIVGGAAGDGSDEGPPPDSPASRARALNPIKPPPQRPDLTAPPPEQPRSRRRTLTRALVVLGIVVALLIGGFYLTRYLVLRQYFVSVSKTGEIGIFQGVRGSFLGVSLNREIEGSCPPNTPACELISVDDLKPIARGTVVNGIIGLQSKQQAESVIQRLRTDQVLPECPKPGTPATGTPGASGRPTTTTKAPARTTATRPGTTTKSPPIGGGAGAAKTTVTPTTTTHPPVPGVDCRKAGN
ncbi:MAG TPA: PP2C family serine/threonine-protein phosphatase [Pseudonocardiaceae bacterium]|jgi:protein phosphatase|nr:PP2C family serine/threonine-protein phosphatase [Pseudonocardiaceae bacterium]